MPTDPPTDSILDTIKQMLGLEPSYSAFDTDIITHINSAFSTLQQLGAGPTNGFAIVDSSLGWSSFTLNKVYLAQCKSYVYIRARLLFDPPVTSFHIESLKEQRLEMEWRLRVAAEQDVVLVDDPGTEVLDDLIWNLTGLDDFPVEAPIGATGIDFATGKVWRKTG